jgi:hypothetical protein
MTEPCWLSDAAEALGAVRPEDGAPLALNWNQVLEAIRDMRDERDAAVKRLLNASDVMEAMGLGRPF